MLGTPSLPLGSLEHHIKYGGTTTAEINIIGLAHQAGACEMARPVMGIHIDGTYLPSSATRYHQSIDLITVSDITTRSDVVSLALDSIGAPKRIGRRYS